MTRGAFRGLVRVRVSLRGVVQRVLQLGFCRVNIPERHLPFCSTLYLLLPLHPSFWVFITVSHFSSLLFKVAELVGDSRNVLSGQLILLFLSLLLQREGILFNLITQIFLLE